MCFGFCTTTLSDWFKKLVPLTHPIRCKTKIVTRTQPWRQLHLLLAVLIGLVRCIYPLPTSGQYGNLKPQLNDLNSSTQHIATLLAQYLQGPAKRLQHFDTTLLGATCCVRLVTLLRHTATCCKLKIELVRMPWRNIVAQTWSSSYAAWKIWPFSNLSQQHPTCRNRVPKHTQHWDMLRPTINVAICCIEMLWSFRRSLKGFGFNERLIWR